MKLATFYLKACYGVKPHRELYSVAFTEFSEMY